MDTIGFCTLQQTPAFARWLMGLKDVRAKAAIVLRLRSVAMGNWGDARSVGPRVFELRWHMGPGYRVYFCRQGQQVIVLLAGGDKSTQKRDIARALAMAKEYEREKDH